MNQKTVIKLQEVLRDHGEIMQSTIDEMEDEGDVRHLEVVTAFRPEDVIRKLKWGRLIVGEDDKPVLHSNKPKLLHQRTVALLGDRSLLYFEDINSTVPPAVVSLPSDEH